MSEYNEWLDTIPYYNNIISYNVTAYGTETRHHIVTLNDNVYTHIIYDYIYDSPIYHPGNGKYILVKQINSDNKK